MAWSRVMVLAMAMVLVVSGSAFAQQETDPARPTVQFRMAIVDIDAILRNSTAVAGIRRQVREYVDAYRADTDTEEETLRTAKQQLDRKRTILAPEAFAEERRKFEQRVTEAQGKVQRIRRAVDEAHGGAMQKVRTALGETIIEVANEKQLTLVVRKEAVVVNSPGLEITKEVLERLNTRLPSVTVSKPVPGQ